MKIAKTLHRFFAIAILTIATSACTGDGEKQVYGIGDVVDVGDDITMVLNSAEFQSNKLEASFTVENRGTEDSGFNLWLSLQARDMEDTPLSQLIPCGSNLDGALRPSEQSTGVICWSPENAETVRIYYLILGFESKIVWEVSK